MLRNLHVKNLALIREVDIDFTPGLNILTGETGAGKSILVDSIGLALGSRVQRDMVPKEGSALTELTFSDLGPSAVHGLCALEVEPEDGEVVISRKMTEGRSTLRICGETRSAMDARKCAEYLIDIHGQSEHQKLLRPEYQLDLLDAYGREEIAEAKKATEAAYKAWHDVKKALGNEDMPESQRLERISFLQFEVDEIENAALLPGEDEKTEQTYQKLAHARKIAEAVDAAHEITGYDQPDSAGEGIGRALKLLEGVSSYDEALGAFTDQLSEVDSLLNDFNRSLADYAEDLSFEEESFSKVEERLNTINRMKQKYGRTIDDILAGLDRRREELAHLEHYEEERKTLKASLAEKEAILMRACEALSELRKKYAETFAEEVTAQLMDLNFARVDFEVAVTRTDSVGANGYDRVDYMISTNPGMPKNVLSRVVSGGELSRIMLGIRTMFADDDETGTLIFDEIDTGISGRTAQKVAEKLAQLAQKHQVLCITHLPQIAAMADSHFGISKSLTDSAAITNVERLDEKSSVFELARMLGGAEITENTVKSAQEMKEQCRQYKQNEL
ncbi:MAG: DNA repair protein RecN [Lachnospiraceae bacterium]|nr:DNA repair protein RecN [Lachnospiraceae bacterium]